MHDWRILFLLLLLCSPVDLKRSGGGGGSSRGGSASRAGVNNGGAGSFNQGGFNQGGARPPPPSNSGGQFRPSPQQPHNVPHNQPNNFNRGPSPNNYHPSPKTSGSTFGKALLGGAAGVLAGVVVYEAGKAIINSASSPFRYEGRNYYWDQNYKGDHNQFQCSMPISQLQQDIKKESEVANSTVGPDSNSTVTSAPVDQTNQTLGNLQFHDGSKPRYISFGCRKEIEVCCGLDCCPVQNNQHQGNSKPSSNLATILFIILLLLLFGGCCCCFIAYFMCRSAFDCIFPRDNKHDNTYQQNVEYEQQYPMQQYGASNYPQQQYGASNYPQQQYGASNYPQQQQYNYPPQPYPSHPTY